MGIPYQGLKPVSGNSFDFRQPKTIAQDFLSDDDQRKVKGYDHAFLLQAKAIFLNLPHRSGLLMRSYR